jgi:chromosome segregation ATPase
MNFTAVMEKSKLEGKKMIFAKAQGALKSINGRINEILSTSGPDSEASPPKPKHDPYHNMESFQTRDFSEDILGEQIDHLKAKLQKLELHTRNLQSNSDENSQILEKKESDLLNLESANSELNSKLDVLEVSKILDQNLVLELRELLESKEKSIEKFELGEKTWDSERRALGVILEGSLEENGKLSDQVTGLGLEVEKREKIIAGLKLRVDGLGKGNAELETFVGKIKKELKDSVEAQEILAKKGDGKASELEKSQKLIEAKDLDLKLAAEKLAASQDLTVAGVSALESKISEHQTAIDAAQNKFDQQNEKLELINENCLD